MGACARNMQSDPAEIKPAQCCIKLVLSFDLCCRQFGTNSIIVLMFVESQRVQIQSTCKVRNKNLECCSIQQKTNIYSYIKSVVYDKLLKPRHSFRITLYLSEKKGKCTGYVSDRRFHIEGKLGLRMNGSMHIKHPHQKNLINSKP